MKPYKIKKKHSGISVRYVSKLKRLPPPQMPRKLFTKVHEAPRVEWTFN
jgi:hypothetical protein